MARKKTWTEKLNNDKPHQVKPVPKDMAGMKAGEIMLVPSARIVDDFIRSIPECTEMDVKTLRKQLAQRFGAEVTCPITAGIHVRIVAEAACEALDAGATLSEITPFWRVLDADAPITRKLSCGVNFVRDQRAREGLSLT